MNVTRRLLLLLAVSLAAGCATPRPPRPEERAEPAGDEFTVLFRRNCSGCHGVEGKFGPAPPLNDPRFLAIFSPEDVEHILTEGRPGTLMPSFSREEGGPLTPEQIKVLAEGLKSHWGDKGWQEQTPPYWADKPGDAKAGREMFELACAACHGDNGQGGEAAGAIHDRAFLQLVSDEMLRRIVITGRPDLHMPPYNSDAYRSPKFKPLTSEQINDLVALLASWRKGEEK